MRGVDGLLRVPRSGAATWGSPIKKAYRGGYNRKTENARGRLIAGGVSLLMGVAMLTALPATAAGNEYRNAVLASDPVAYWRLDESSGPSATDAAGGGLDAVFKGTPRYAVAGLVSDAGSRAARFDGSPDGVDLPDSHAINTARMYTKKSVELWFRADSVTSRQVLYEEGGLTRGLAMYVYQGRLYMGGWNTANDDASTPWGPSYVSTPVEANTTYHAVLVYDRPAGRVKGFLNGVNVGNKTGVGNLYSHSNDAGIAKVNDNVVFHNGSWTGDGRWFGGVIDEVALYNDVLSASTIAAHYTIGAVPPTVPYDELVLDANPIAYWRLGETGGATAADSSGNGLAGTYLNNPTLGAPALLNGVSNSSVRFDGTNDHVDLPSDAAINDGGPYMSRTVEAWFDVASTTSAQMIFEEGGQARGLSLYVKGGAVHAGGWNTVDDGINSPWGPVFVSTPVSAGATYHVVFVMDHAANTLRLYTNGIQRHQRSGVGALYGHTRDGAIGAMRDDSRTADSPHAGNGMRFGGRIDEVALYDDALSAATVAHHHAVGTTGEPSPDPDPETGPLAIGPQTSVGTIGPIPTASQPYNLADVLNENSGLAVHPGNPAILAGHEDNADDARIWFFAKDGAAGNTGRPPKAIYNLPGTEAGDFEELASDGTNLYVWDNDENGVDVVGRIFKFLPPPVTVGQAFVQGDMPYTMHLIRLKLPTGGWVRRGIDIEGVAIHRQTGDLLLVEKDWIKRFNDDPQERPMLWRVPGFTTAAPGSTVVGDFIGRLAGRVDPNVGSANVGGLLLSMDISPDGNVLAVKNHEEVMLYYLGGNSDWAQRFDEQSWRADPTDVFPIDTSEALVFGQSMLGLYSLTEGAGNRPNSPHVHRYSISSG